MSVDQSQEQPEHRATALQGGGCAGSGVQGCAVILGVTSPIARGIAIEAGNAGYSIFAAARDGDEAAGIAADIAIRTGAETAGAAFDALDMGGHADLLRRAEEALGPLRMVVLVFGEIGDPERSRWCFEEARRVLDINFTGAASLSEAAVPHLLASAASRPGANGLNVPTLVGVGSVAGDRGRQSNYVYGSAKGAFALYLQGLRNRLAKQGVHVLTVKPGFIDTRMTQGLKTAIPIASPESLARAVMKSVERGRDVLYFPWFWRWIMMIIKAIPERVFKRLSL